MTERLYYADPYLKEWTGRIIERTAVEGMPAVVLDRTALYPGGGGQPQDRGTINGITVTGSVEDGDRILHIVERLPDVDEVRCVLDWPRRYDLMQQHTAQHILSEAFLRVAGAPTVSFHLTEESATIDLPVADLPPGSVEAAERLANEKVAAATPVRVHWFESGQPISLPLRKQPDVEGAVRIVSVEGFDNSPCGGVHCTNAAEIQLIKIARLERRGGETRVHYMSGGRALADYGAKLATVSTLARQLSVGEPELVQAVNRISDESRALRKELLGARESLIEFDAQQMLAAAEVVGGVRVVAKVVPGADGERIKHLAQRITASGGAMALLAAATDKVALVFARSEDGTADMGRLLRAVAPLVGGSGGGRPNFAQGGGPKVDGAEAAIQAALEQLRSAL